MSSRLFIVAGEASGDVIGAELLHGLRKRRRIEAIGVGGPLLQAEGLASIYPMDDLSVMGFSDVAWHLPLLFRRLWQTATQILSERPNLVLLIDNQVFSAMLARRLRKKGFKGPIILYVAPSVWAWKPKRAPALVPLFDEVLAVLPFEPQAMARLGGPSTVYVGHPAVRRIPPFSEQAPERGPLALLPGSRRGELKRHLPLFRAVAENLASHPAIERFVLPTLPHLADRLRNSVRDWNVDIEVLDSREAHAEILPHCVAALACAGTATLELALYGVPFVGTYLPDRLQMAAYRSAGAPLIALPNIILQKELVPEVAPGPGHAERLSDAMTRLLDTPQLRDAQREGFAELRQVMEEGMPGNKKEDAVDRILSHLPPV